MLTTQSENFQKFEFEFLAGIVSNNWWAKIQKNQLTVTNAVHLRLNPVAMLVDISAVERSPLCPDPSRETWRRRGRTRPGPRAGHLLGTLAPALLAYKKPLRAHE
jgi:hypothetical protein